MKKIILLTIVLFGAISCNQDLLDEVKEKTLAESVVFSDLTLTRAYVDATYNDVLTGEGFQAEKLDAFSDNVYYVHNSGAYDFLGGVMDPDNVKSINGDLWWVTYKSVRRINIFFKAIADSPLSENDKKNLIAEMKFLRAWTYARAIDHYGGVVIYEDVFDLSNQNFKLPRNTYDECLAYVIKDLDDAATVLSMRDMSGKASGIAALALKSRVLLSAASLLHNPTKDQSKWLAANKASQAVIDIIGSNSLHSNYAQVFLGTTIETIWQRNYTVDNSHNVNTMNNPNGYNGWGGNTPLQSLVDAYDMANGKPITDPSSGYNPQDPYINRESRFYASINYNGAVWKNRTVQTFRNGLDTYTGPIQPWNGGKTGYYMKKFLNENEPINEDIPSTTPWIFFRAGEIYLNYAETFLALNDETNAKLWMNKTRARAGLSPITETGNALVDRYRNERRVEMAFENTRNRDIIRWKLAETVLNTPAKGVTITGSPGAWVYDYSLEVLQRAFNPAIHYYEPIPRSETVKSKEYLLQNPGYN
jgi:hypothetical protein